MEVHIPLPPPPGQGAGGRVGAGALPGFLINGFYWESDWKGLSRKGQVLAAIKKPPLLGVLVVVVV